MTATEGAGAVPNSLLDRRFLVVTGKGGVGKSSVAAAMAVAASARGKRTLVCELDATGDIGRLLGVGDLDFSGVDVDRGLRAMAMDTEASLREYLKVQARIPMVGRIGPLARAFDFVATAAPGVREVLTVGKLAYEIREDHYDLVIADGTASGHVVGQLAAPAAIRELVRVGMIRNQLDWMLEILEDPAQTAAVVVATPEEMPVVETLELVARMASDAHVDLGAAVVNKVLPAPFTRRETELFDRLATGPLATRFGADVEPALSATRFLLDRRHAETAHLHRLRDGLDASIPVLLAPFDFESTDDRFFSERLAAALAAEAGW